MRRILTGSPVTKSPLDLYSQCAFLDPALLGFKSYYAFRNRYCTFDEVYIARGEAIMVPDGYTNLDELEQKLKNFSLRLTKDECLDIPEKIYQKREVMISGDQKRIYDRLRMEALAKFENETISVHNQLTELLRLHQVANGYCKSDDGEILQFNNEKLKALLEILEETDKKVIIWATYVHNINEIIASLNDKYGSETVVSIYGETAPYVSKGLNFLTLDDWKRYYRDNENEDDADSQNYGEPIHVIKSPDHRKFGLSPIPDKVYNVHFYAYTKPTKLSAHGDTIVFPEQYSNVITARVRYYVWQFKESPQQAAFALD